MEQTFEYPNIMTGSRSNTLRFETSGNSLLGVHMSDNVVGDYQRVTLDADAKNWAYLQVAGVNGVGDVPEGTELAISCFARIKGGPCRIVPSIRQGNSLKPMHDNGTTTWDDVGGGWTICTTMAKRNAIAYGGQVFYITLALGKAGTTYDIAQPMVCVADKPHARGHRQQGRCGLNER